MAIPTNFVGQQQVREKMLDLFPGQPQNQARLDADDHLPNGGNRATEVTTLTLSAPATPLTLSIAYPATQYKFERTIVLPGGSAAANATAVADDLKTSGQFTGFYIITTAVGDVVFTARVDSVEAVIGIEAGDAGVSLAATTPPNVGERLIFGYPVFKKLINGILTASGQPSAPGATEAEFVGIAKRVRTFETPEGEHLGGFPADAIVSFRRFGGIGVSQTATATATFQGGEVWMGIAGRAGEFLTADDGGGDLVQMVTKIKWLKDNVVECNCAI